MKARMIVLFGAVAALAACGGPTWRATLTPGAEVPAVTGSNGSGSATVTMNGTMLDVTGTYMGLSGAATAAHIHGPAAATATAPAVCTIQFTEGSPAGTGTIQGSCNTTDVTVANLDASMFYVNVHTAAHGGGEIRGQLAK